MLATTWVQIVKAILLMAGTILLSILVMAHFHFSFGEFLQCGRAGQGWRTRWSNFLQPGLRYKPPYGALDLISLGLALIFGTAGLPHILVRFYTVPDAKTARISVVWAMVIIGSFYIMTTFLGFGAATIVGQELHRQERRHQHERSAAGAGARRAMSSSPSSRRSRSPRFWPWSPG